MKLEPIKYTNEMLDKFVMESNCPQNSLGLKISFEYAINEVCLNWSDLWYGVEYEFFDESVAIEYAILQLENESYDEAILELASTRKTELSREELLEKYVRFFAKNGGEKSKEIAKNKMLYLVLKLLYENRDLFENPFHALQIIYDDFGFPENIASFIPYMPDSEAHVEMKDFSSDEEKLYYRWACYLEEAKKIFGVNSKTVLHY